MGQDEARSQEARKLGAAHTALHFPRTSVGSVGTMEAGRSWPAGGNPRMALMRASRPERPLAIRGLPPAGHARHVDSSLGAGQALSVVRFLAAHLLPGTGDRASRVFGASTDKTCCLRFLQAREAHIFRCLHFGLPGFCAAFCLRIRSADNTCCLRHILVAFRKVQTKRLGSLRGPIGEVIRQCPSRCEGALRKGESPQTAKKTSSSQRFP